MTNPMLLRDFIVDYLNSDASKYEGIALSRTQLNEIAVFLGKYSNSRELLDPLRNCNTHNEYLEELKKIVF